MRIEKVFSLTEVLHNILADLEAGVQETSDGEPMSDYHALAEDADGYTLSVSVIKCTDEEYQDQWYSLHVIDDITMRNCELVNTATLDEMEILHGMATELHLTMDKVCYG